MKLSSAIATYLVVGLWACSDRVEGLDRPEGGVVAVNDGGGTDVDAAPDLGPADATPDDASFDAGPDAGFVDCHLLGSETGCLQFPGRCKPFICRPCGERFYAGCYFESEPFALCPDFPCDAG